MSATDPLLDRRTVLKGAAGLGAAAASPGARWAGRPPPPR